MLSSYVLKLSQSLPYLAVVFMNPNNSNDIKSTNSTGINLSIGIESASFDYIKLVFSYRAAGSDNNKSEKSFRSANSGITQGS